MGSEMCIRDRNSIPARVGLPSLLKSSLDLRKSSNLSWALLGPMSLVASEIRLNLSSLYDDALNNPLPPDSALGPTPLPVASVVESDGKVDGVAFPILPADAGVAAGLGLFLLLR